MENHAADLALSGLTKAYGRVVAVDHVTLRVPTGKAVALLGPSGCGKTTTLRMIAGLVEPTEGDILIGGRAVTRVPVHRRNIGMLFQSYALFPHLSVGQNVAFGLEMRGVKKADAARRVGEALQLVRLDHLAARLPGALSGGQQQRVALARALVIEPSVLLLDEPLGALDKGLRETMQVELRQLQQRLGITTVIVTHDQEEALTLADQIVIMRSGRLEQVGTPEEVYARPVSRFVAGFVGSSNFLKGTVTGRGNGVTLVAMESGGRITVPASDRDGAPGALGETVLVALRPEAIGLDVGEDAGQDAGEDDASPNTIAATVEQVIYRGSLTHVHLRLDNGESLLAHHRDRARAGIGAGRLAPGGRVRARWSENDNTVVADA